jgi:hypothetical protein
MFHKLIEEEKIPVISYLIASSSINGFHELADTPEQTFYDALKKRRNGGGRFDNDVAYFIDNSNRDPEGLWFASSRQDAKKRQLAILQKVKLDEIPGRLDKIRKAKLKACLMVKRAALLPDANSENEADQKVLAYYWKNSDYHALFVENAFSSVENAFSSVENAFSSVADANKDQKKLALLEQLKVAGVAEKLAEQLLPQGGMWGWLTGQNKKRKDFIEKCLAQKNKPNENSSIEEILLSAFIKAKDNTNDAVKAFGDHEKRIPVA